jgi:hypothetical protein
MNPVHDLIGPALASGSEPARLQTLTELLTRRIARGRTLQELCPVSQSVPWLQSQRYWARAGVEVFTSGEVPYIVTNDGEQSRKALEVYLTSLRAADSQRQREPMSYVLELGAGSGLFAKLFLDQLRDRSHAQGTDDYARTTYIVGDKSPSLLGDMVGSTSSQPAAPRCTTYSTTRARTCASTATRCRTRD